MIVHKVYGGIVGGLSLSGICIGVVMTGIGLGYGEVNVSDQGTTVIVGSLLASAFVLLSRSLGKQQGLQGKRDELDREREQLYAARAALDLESERLCRESDVNDRKRDEKAQLERRRDREDMEREFAARSLDLENRLAIIERDAYAKGLEHGMRGLIDDDPSNVVIYLPVTHRGESDGHAPRAGEH